jgi:hypothetical protein
LFVSSSGCERGEQPRCGTKLFHFAPLHGWTRLDFARLRYSTTEVGRLQLHLPPAASMEERRRYSGPPRGDRQIEASYRRVRGRSRISNGGCADVATINALSRHVPTRRSRRRPAHLLQFDCSRAPQPVASRYRRRRLIIATGPTFPRRFCSP